MNQAQLQLSTIGQIGFSIRDLEQAVPFYRDVLGLKLLFAMSNMAFFDCDGVRLMLAVPTAEEFDTANSILYFKVDDIHISHEHLVAHNVQIDEPPHLVAKMPDHELWMTFLRDPENNVLALMSEIS